MTAADISKGPWFGQRHVQTLLLFSVIVVNYLTKYNAGVAVVAMTNADTTNPDYEEFDWDEKQRSYILSSFYWGYIVTNLPGGSLARRFGTKSTILVVTLGSSLLSIIVPWCVPWGDWQAYCTIRILQGLFQGPLFPCIYAYLASWCPAMERNRLGALANTGIECGNLLAMYLSGTLAASPLGWPSVFYVPGALGLVWCIFWLIFAANSPGKSRFITAEERNYIISSKINQALESSQSNQAVVKTDEAEKEAKEAQKEANEAQKEVNETQKGSNEAEKTAGEAPPTIALQEVEIREIPVPWRAILTSVPFIMLVLVRCAEGWGFHTLQQQIPSYMFGVLYMDMNENAIFSALPYLAMWVMSYVFLIASDVLLGKGWLSLTAVRRLINSIAFYVPAAMLIGIGYLDVDQRQLAIVLMTLNVGFNAGSTIGSALNAIDLAPNHAGILMSIVNTIANMVPLFTPLVVGVVVTDEHDRSQWQIIFFIAAIVFIAGNTIYIIFGSTDVQPWNDENFLLRQKEGQEDGQQEKEQVHTKPTVYTIEGTHKTEAKAGESNEKLD